MQAHSKLGHLSVEQVADLLRQYHDPSIALVGIISEFSIQTTPSALSALLPPLIHEDSPCPHCEGFLLQSRRARRPSYVSPTGRCPNCGHQDTNCCSCLKCCEAAAKDRFRIQEIKRDIIRKNYVSRCWNGNLANITLHDAVYLSAIIRQSISEDLSAASPYLPGPPMLAPTNDYKNRIVRHLQERSFLAIDPDSRVEAFEFNAELTKIHSLYPAKVGWLFLPGVDVAGKRSFMRSLDDTIDGDWPDTWKEQLPILWRDIVKAEAFEYFLHLLEQRGYKRYKIGEKTNAVFDFLIERFPLSKMCNLIWQSVRDITDYNVKNNIPTYHARNNFVGAIRKKAERCIAEGWNLKDSRRDFSCPQTWISSTFFDVFAKIGERGFVSTPPVGGICPSVLRRDRDLSPQEDA